MYEDEDWTTPRAGQAAAGGPLDGVGSKDLGKSGGSFTSVVDKFNIDEVVAAVDASYEGMLRRVPLDGEDSATVTVEEGVVFDVVAEIKDAWGVASSEVPAPSPSVPTADEEDTSVEEVKLNDTTLAEKEKDEDVAGAAVQTTDAITEIVVDESSIVTPPVSAGKKKMAQVMTTAHSDGDEASKTKWKVARTFKVARPSVVVRNKARVE